MKPKTSTEQGRASHPCAACGGRGVLPADGALMHDKPKGKCVCGHGWGFHGPTGHSYCRGTVRAAWKTEGVGARPCDCGEFHPKNLLQPPSAYYAPADCPVCLGAGQLSDRMPARDAVADAETLRFIAAASDYSVEFQTWIGSPSTLALNRAVMNADMAIHGAVDFSRERGELAAHDAFRVVPGLR